MDSDVASLVLGRNIDPSSLRAGILHGYERLLVAEETYPALAPRAGGKVAGLVVDQISATDLSRMQFFESEEFAPVACEIELVSGGYVSAQAFLARDALPFTDRRWDFDDWQRDDKHDYLVLVREWMDQYGRREAHELEAAWSSARRDQLDQQSAGADRDEQHTNGAKS